MQELAVTVVISFILALGLGYIIIPMLKRLKAGQQIRSDGPQEHLKKAGTPTMGGIIIMLVVTIISIIFMKDDWNFILFAVCASLAFGFLGLIDDLIIVLKKRSLGLRARQKLVFQIILGVLIALYAYNSPDIGSKLYVPFVNIEWDLGIWYIPFTTFIVVALINSVNLIDGLDGLASGVTLINSATYTLIFYAMMGTGMALSHNLMIFAAAVTGACLGFLRFNTYPAKVFMGDTGSFFLGGALCVMAISSRLQLMIPLMGLMYWVTSLSCILQVGSYKLRNKKRIFKMAPLHHHFELSGVPETKIVAMYMIITTIACLLSLVILGG